MGRIPRRVGIPDIHMFERVCSFVLPFYSTTGWANYPTGTTGYGGGLALQFALTVVNIFIGDGSVTNTLTQVSLPSAAEFTALFDQYIIKKVNLRVYPMQQLTNAPGIANTNVNVIYSAVDNDDSIPPLLSTIQQYRNVKVDQPGDGLKQYNHTFVPKPLIQMYATSVSTSYGVPKGSTWIDCNDASTPHYGWKMCADKTNIATLALLGSYNFVVKYTIACKGVR